MTLLANQNLMQVRTQGHSALLVSQDGVDWQIYLLVILHVILCFQWVQDLWILAGCSWSPGN